MPRVPAHTNDVGSFTVTESLITTETTYNRDGSYYQGTGPVTQQNVAKNVRHSSKSATVDGAYSSTFPGFRKPTPYERVVGRCENVQSFEQHTYYGTGQLFKRTVGDGRQPFSTNGILWARRVSANLQNRVTTECLLDVQNMSVNLGAALGEAKTTAQMVANRIHQLARVISALRKGKWSHAYYQLFGRNPKTLGRRDAANLWLEWSYGWRPLLSDIYNGVELIREGFRGNSLLFSARRTRSEQLDPADLFGGYNVGRVTDGEARESSQVILYGSVTSNLSVLSSLGLINPLALAWELTRLSFVIDWLLPIGNWLQSLSATVGITFVGGCRTDQVFADVEAEHVKPLLGVYVIPPKARIRYLNVKRTPFQAWPGSLPYYVNPFSISHLTSATALLSQSRR